MKEKRSVSQGEDQSNRNSIGQSSKMSSTSSAGGSSTPSKLIIPDIFCAPPPPTNGPTVNGLSAASSIRWVIVTDWLGLGMLADDTLRMTVSLARPCSAITSLIQPLSVSVYQNLYFLKSHSKYYRIKKLFESSTMDISSLLDLIWHI